MPALDISLDGTRIATVSTDGFTVMAVNVGGTLIDEEFASVDVSGGSYPKGAPSTYLTWVSQQALQPGQRIKVTFLESGISSHAGKTIGELYPDAPPSSKIDFTPTDEMMRELRAKPKRREKFTLHLTSSKGKVFDVETRPEEHSFGFSILWISYQPEHARVSLHSYTLDSLENRGSMNNHVREQLEYGDSVELQFR
jgi:hypothetical protein